MDRGRCASIPNGLPRASRSASRTGKPRSARRSGRSAKWTGEFVLLLAGDGCVYAETTSHVLKLGVTFPDALRSLLRADARPERVL